MNDNKLDIRRLDRWRLETLEMYRVMGLREAQYVGRVGELADAGMQKIISRASQFLFDFEEYGAGVIQERQVCKSRQTPYNHRTFAFNIISNYATK